MSVLSLPEVTLAHAYSPTRAGADTLVSLIAQFVREVAVLHDAAFGDGGRVRTYLDARTLTTDGDAASALMGYPARYADVVMGGDDGERETDGYAGDIVRRTVLVTLYWGCIDEDGHALPNEEDAAAFRRLVDGHSATAPGLIHALQMQRHLTDAATGETASLVRARFSDTPAVEQTYTGQGVEVWRHTATLELTLDL